ncbi:hypothetical protein OESDEN_06988, partial [Oesophagostomum dentatum]
MKALAWYLLTASVLGIPASNSKCEICRDLSVTLHWSSVGTPQKRMQWLCDGYKNVGEKKLCRQVADELSARKDVIESSQAEQGIK